MDIRIKRVYDPPCDGDGYRVLVDRLWPRGVRKDSLVMDEWNREVAPSTSLRKAWHSAEISDDEFYSRYAAELEGSEELAALAQRMSDAGAKATLLIAAKNVEASHAHILKAALLAVGKFRI